jgi:hypothetical protein
LTPLEKREGTQIDHKSIEFAIERDVDCVGCSIYLKNFLNELIQYTI